MDECDFCLGKRLDRGVRLSITDIEKLRILHNLIETAKQRLASFEMNPVKYADDILQERLLLNASKTAAYKLEQTILFYEDQ